MDKANLNIERVRCDSLILDPANVRTHSAANLEAIKGSLARFGQQRPIVVNRDNIVLAGNGTLTAARALGWESIAIHRTELSGLDAIGFALADNRTAELAGWDTPGLADVTAALAVEGFDLGSIGFSDDFLKSLSEVPDLEPREDDDEKIPEEKRVKCPECGHHFSP